MRRSFALLMVLTFAPHACAHDLGATYKIRDGRVELEAYFNDDTPARGATVVVKDSSGNVIAQGKTDHDGKWSCPVPEQEICRIVVDAGDGHNHVIDLTRGSDQPTRTEFTRTPWVKIGLGLFLIALVAVGIQAGLRRARSATNPAGPSSPAHPSPPGPT